MSDSDPDLSRTLQSWRHEPPSAPRFNAEVWGRVAARRDLSAAVASYLGSRLGISARISRWAVPLGASLMLVLAAFAGARAGVERTARARNERMAAAYVRTIDPLQMRPANPAP